MSITHNKSELRKKLLDDLNIIHVTSKKNNELPDLYVIGVLIDAYIATNYISKQRVEEAIGKDNYITEPSGNSRLDQQVQNQLDGENKIRATIRKALGLEVK